MGGKKTVVILSCWLLGPSDLLRSAYCGRWHWADLPPHARVGKQGLRRGLKSSENSFALAMSQSQLLVFKQYWTLGKFRCRPEMHGLAKDCCYCHMPDLLKITLIQKLNMFSWQWWSICVKEEIFQSHRINLVMCYHCLIDVLPECSRSWGAFSCSEALTALRGG